MKKIAVATAALVFGAGLVFSSEAQAEVPSSTSICPDGFKEIFNTNEPGCSFCYPDEGCDPTCAAPPIPPPPCEEGAGKTECCAENPCAENCPDRPLTCFLSACICESAPCPASEECFTACPGDRQPAPTASPYGIAALLIALGGFGAWRLRKRAAA